MILQLKLKAIKRNHQLNLESTGVCWCQEIVIESILQGLVKDFLQSAPTTPTPPSTGPLTICLPTALPKVTFIASLAFSESVLKPREFIWVSGEYRRGRSLILRQIPKLLEQMVRVSRRKTVNVNHAALDAVVLCWTTGSAKSCQSLDLISAELTGRRETVNTTLVAVFARRPGSSGRSRQPRAD